MALYFVFSRLSLRTKYLFGIIDSYLGIIRYTLDAYSSDNSYSHFDFATVILVGSFPYVRYSRPSMVAS